ncbi:PASTA domain-containing protein [Rathayibacter oskolensis]|uniref:PASTA domain-containing protein n=1 Tax=Rathayibacter oskolensis TaxID=1891671 RepID=UPI003466E796
MLDEPVEEAADEDAVARLAARRRVRRRRGVLLTVVVLLLALLGGGTAWWFGEGPGAIVSIPDVVSKSQDEATAELQAQGFEVSPQQMPDLTVPAGLVMSSDPPGGQGVHKGSVITLTVSSGPRQLEVPALAGLSQDEATAAITNGSFTPGEVTKIFDADVAAGVVISASLPDGSALPATMSETSTIAMVVSLGSIPDVVGLSLEEATDAAEKAGLAIDSSGEDWSDTVPAGVVLTQANPEAPATTGDTISVVVSKGPEPVAVPNVVGMTRDQAKAALDAVDLTWSYLLSSSLIDAVPDAATKVTAQSYAAGAPVQRGTSVQLSITITI